ncbi:MAG: NAD(P)-dependent oxidoreductase [Candidatus Bathyarchaeota archaeon]|nr:NAD(P)-dependent oxidoreductase [Candidatus Bathyarchaeota archaeon]
MKILVTGGRGFLGTYVCQMLTEYGHQVIDTDIQGNGIHLDVTKLDEVTQLFKKVQPELVIHLAAVVGGGPSKAKPYQYFYVNTLGTLNVLEACRQNNILKLIYMSSFSPFGETSKPINELTPFEPTNPYGGSKASAEFIVNAYSRCFNIKTIIFRACLIAGEGQMEYNALQEFVDCALRSDPLIIFGSGEHKREWLHPIDVVKAYVLGIQYLQSMSQPFDIFNLGSGEPISMRRLAEKIIEISTSSSKVIHKRSGSVTFDQVTDATKARKKFRWKPEVRISEIISQVVIWRKGLLNVQENHP